MSRSDGKVSVSVCWGWFCTFYYKINIKLLFECVREGRTRRICGAFFFFFSCSRHKRRKSRGNADYLCHCGKTSSQIRRSSLGAPAGISGSCRKKRLCRGTRRAAVSPWHLSLPPLESLFLISTTVCLN